MTKDLNRLSAERIMEWHIENLFTPSTGIWHDEDGDRIPFGNNMFMDTVNWNPLTDMNQCFRVVAAKMVREGWGWNIEHTVVYKELSVEIYKDSDPDIIEEMREDAKHCVCEYYADILDLNRAFLTAALKAKGVEV